MPRPDAAAKLAAGLPALQHPDGTILRALGFNDFLMQAAGDHEAVKQINALALAHAEAIIHTLENNGYTLTHKDDPKPINQAGTKTATINCKTCSKLLIGGVVLDDQLHANVPGAAFITAITKRKLECPHV